MYQRWNETSEIVGLRKMANYRGLNMVVSLVRVFRWKCRAEKQI